MTGPYPTLEVRWFLRGDAPEVVAAWFDRLGDPVEAETRTDRYLAPTDGGLGVKVRTGNLEAKRRAAVEDPLQLGTAEGPAEAWEKWSFPLADDGAEPEAGWIAVDKTRWQRRRQTERGACALELSALTVGGEAWWSVCLEASGPTRSDRRAMLDAGARAWLGRLDAPALPAGAAMGYPAWLRLAIG